MLYGRSPDPSVFTRGVWPVRLHRHVCARPCMPHPPRFVLSMQHAPCKQGLASYNYLSWEELSCACDGLGEQEKECGAARQVIKLLSLEVRSQQEQGPLQQHVSGCSFNQNVPHSCSETTERGGWFSPSRVQSAIKQLSLVRMPSFVAGN